MSVGKDTSGQTSGQRFSFAGIMWTEGARESVLAIVYAQAIRVGDSGSQPSRGMPDALLRRRFLGAAGFFDRLFVSGDADDGGQRVVLVQAHDPHALRVAADHADFAGDDSLNLAARGHHQQFVVVADAHDADHRPVALGGLDVAQTLAAAPLRAVPCCDEPSPDSPSVSSSPVSTSAASTSVSSASPSFSLRTFGPSQRAIGAEGGAFAVAVFAGRQQRGLGIGHDHADQLVAGGQIDSLDAAGIAAHRSGVGLVEANRHAAGRGQHDFVPRCVTTTSTSSSSSLSLMAMMPPLSGRLYCIRSVFFTSPRRVAIIR